MCVKEYTDETNYPTVNYWTMTMTTMQARQTDAKCEVRTGDNESSIVVLA